MVKPAWSGVLRFVRARVGLRQAGVQSDAALLQSFALQHEEAALVTLLQRHGPLVLATCRQVLHDEHAAEDAFQATFLVLARKAGTLYLKESLAPWLHQVAYRAALKLKTAAARREAHEEEAMATIDRTDAPVPADWLAILHEEVNCLPERYRRPVVLCYFQGRSYADAAAELSWPAGTVGSRLNRARDLLQRRLVRRGVTLSTGALCIGSAEAHATVPPALVAATARSALVCLTATGFVPGPAAVAGALLQDMLWSRLKLLIVLMLVVSAAGASAMVFAPPGAGTQPVAADDGEPPVTLPPVQVQPPRLDLLGDPLPPDALFRVGSTRLQHASYLDRLAFGAGRKILASASADGTLRLWDMTTGKELGRWPNPRVLADPPEGFPGPFALSADGTLLAAQRRDRDGAFCLWKVTSHQVRWCVRGPVAACAFTLDGKLLIGVQGKHLRHWEVVTGKMIRDQQLDFDAGQCSCVLAPHGQRLAWANTDPKNAKVWIAETATGQAIQEWSGLPKDVAQLAFTPDGKVLACVAADDTVIRLWDCVAGRQVRRLEMPASPRSVALSPDNRTLAALGGDGQLCLWDWTTGQERRRKTADQFGTVAFSPDGGLLAYQAPANAIRLWDVAADKDVTPVPLPRPIYGVAYSPNGHLLATWPRQGDDLQLWDTQSGRVVRRFPAGTLASFSPDGRLLAIVTETWTREERTCRVRLIEVTTGQEQGQLRADGVLGGGPPMWSADGKQLALCQRTGDSAGTDWVRVWATATQAEVACWKSGHKGGQVVPAPDASAYAVLDPTEPEGAGPPSKDKHCTVRVIRCASGRELCRLRDVPLAIRWRGVVRVGFAPYFTPDGRVLVSAAGKPEDAEVRFTEVATGKEVLRLPASRFDLRFQFTADARLLASVDEDDVLCIVDVASDRVVHRLGEAGATYSRDYNFSPDGRILVERFKDRPLRLWEVATGKEIRCVGGAESPTGLWYFSPDGRTLTSVADNTALVWDMTGLLREGHLQSTALSSREIEQSWDALASADASLAHRGIWRLTAAARQTLPLLAERLRPIAVPPPERVAQLIADLDSGDFAVRQKASGELEQLEAVQDALAKALSSKPSLETRQRIEILQRRLADPAAVPARLQMLRAAEVLEHIGTSEAKEILEKLAGGAEGARLTREAKASRERLAKQSTSQ